MLQITHLLKVADAYLSVSNAKTEKTVSYRVFGDTKKLTALRGDGDITVGRFNAAMLWFYENWPDGSEVPSILIAYQPPHSPEKDVA